ncbi:hypothetical protein SALBM311S_00621 [Streptomyces alboniger]
MAFSDPRHDARERIAYTARTVQHTRTVRLAIRLLLTRGIRPQVPRSRPTESPWVDVTFTHGATSVRWSNTYYPHGHSLRFKLLPLALAPTVLAAVDSAPDSELAAFHDPTDFKGEAAGGWTTRPRDCWAWSTAARCRAMTRRRLTRRSTARSCPGAGRWRGSPSWNCPART